MLKQANLPFRYKKELDVVVKCKNLIYTSKVIFRDYRSFNAQKGK